MHKSCAIYACHTPQLGTHLRFQSRFSRLLYFLKLLFCSFRLCQNICACILHVGVDSAARVPTRRFFHSLRLAAAASNVRAKQEKLLRPERAANKKHETCITLEKETKFPSGSSCVTFCFAPFMPVCRSAPRAGGELEWKKNI